MAAGGAIPYDIPGYNTEMQTGQYPVEQPQQQTAQQGGMSPAQAYSVYSQYAGAQPASTGASSASAGGGGVATALPWVAAALAGSEYHTKQRNKDGTRVHNWDDFWTGNASHKLANHYESELNDVFPGLGDQYQSIANAGEFNIKKAVKEGYNAAAAPFKAIKGILD